MKLTNYVWACMLSLFFTACDETGSMSVTENAVYIPLKGNTYLTAGERNDAKVTRNGVESWTGEDAILSSWFKTTSTGKLKLFLKATSPEGGAIVKVTCQDKTFKVNMDQQEETIYPVGIVNLKEPGYVRVDIQGIKKQGEQFAVISDIVVDGEAAQEPMNFVRDFETYWGLRGPSVHMKYTLPENEDIEYFYNEMTIPQGEDVMGSYFMANGFGEGYFGIQVNSPTERRILFSVWSPFSTDNPADIPEDQRIILLDKGENVYTGEFGNEGSGGQSYLKHYWKAGLTYKFLTRVYPDGKGNTTYTAWFYDAEKSNWNLIASFLRPKTDTWYRNPHSFLENFITNQGYLTRKVLYGNQWARTTKGEWKELTEGMFTYDNTARAQVRLDYAGGIEGANFFLKNCGFFNENTEYKSMFTRPETNTPPVIEGIF